MPREPAVPAAVHDSDLLDEVRGLTDEVEPLLRTDPHNAACELPPFKERCQELLARHLGFAAPDHVTPIQVIGDSHAQFFSGAERILLRRLCKVGLFRPHWINRGPDLLPCFRSFHVGPATAWMSFDKKSSTRSRAKTKRLLAKHVPPGSTVITCFGEIDCRIHMPRAVLAGKSVSEVAKATADRFFPLVRLVRQRGFESVVWGVAQAPPRPPDQPEAEFLAVGPEHLRLEITYAYNEALADLCEAEGFTFIGLAGTFHPRDELMPEDCFYDGWHMSQKLMPHALRSLREAGVLGF